LFGTAIFLAICLSFAHPAPAQVVPAGDAGGWNLSAGGMATGALLNYGERKMLGITAFADLETKRRIGIEGEARWLVFHQTANVNTTTYAIGPRYHLDIGRFQPYAKGLVGFGDFNFPYNLATGRYLVIAPGGGVDWHFSRRIRIRIVDAEYQIWPQFTYGGTLSELSVSSGVRVNIFR
jgi:hypothetical protein